MGFTTLNPSYSAARARQESPRSGLPGGTAPPGSRISISAIHCACCSRHPRRTTSISRSCSPHRAGSSPATGWRSTAAWKTAPPLECDVGATIAAPAGSAGAAACATLILAPPKGEPGAFLEAARDVQARSSAIGMQAGATVVGGLLVARWLAQDALPLRRAYTDLACHLRHTAMGLPPRLPRLWHV